MKKIYRIKTNNQEQLQRKQNESDATSKWIEFQVSSKPGCNRQAQEKWNLLQQETAWRKTLHRWIAKEPLICYGMSFKRHVGSSLAVFFGADLTEQLTV